MAAGPEGVVGEEVEPGGGEVLGVDRGVEAGADPGGELRHGVAADARGGQFDGERDAFEAAADVGGGRPVPRRLQVRVRVGRAQPVLEEPERVGGAVDRERLDADDVLAPGVERLPAGDQDGQPRRGGDQLGQQMGAGAAEVFGGVEDEQEALVAEPFAERLDGHPQGVVREPDRVRDGGEQQGVVVERGEVGPPGAVGVAVGGGAGGPDGEPGLADAAGADQGGHPPRGQRGVQPGQFGPPPDEAARLVGKESHLGHHHTVRHAGAEGTGGADRPGRGSCRGTGTVPPPLDEVGSTGKTGPAGWTGTAVAAPSPASAVTVVRAGVSAGRRPPPYVPGR